MTQSHRHKKSSGLSLVFGFILLFSACSPAAQKTGILVSPTVDSAETAAFATEQALRYPSATPTLTNAQKAAITPTAIPPTLTPTTTPGIQPPACTFPLAQTTMAEPKPENYSFSEPKVVMTAPQGNYYGIVEWLPNNRQVLITEHLGNIDVGNDKVHQESISLYNPETGKSKLVAMRSSTHMPPAWVPDLNAVVYPVMNYYDVDKKNRTYKLARQIWVSYGNPDTAQILANDLPQLFLAVAPGGNEIAYFSDKGVSKLDKSLKVLPSISFDPSHWDYATMRRSNVPLSFKMTWQPSTSLIFLYSEGNGQGGYTFILNADTGRVCELNLGGLAFEAHWSSDGRYLAYIRSTKFSYLTYSADLTVLDTVTGSLSVLDIMPQETKGLHLVSGFVWAPDNRHLLASGKVFIQGIQSDIGLYLVDFVSGEVDSLFPSSQFNISWWGTGLAWSPDGSKLLVRCPTHEVDRLCFISVRRIEQ